MLTSEVELESNKLEDNAATLQNDVNIKLPPPSSIARIVPIYVIKLGRMYVLSLHPVNPRNIPPKNDADMNVKIK